MDIEKLIESVRLCGSTPKVDQCKQCAYWSGGDMSKCIPRMTTDAATALSMLQAENKRLNKIVCSIPTTPDSGRTVSQYDKEMSMCAYLDDLEAENEKLREKIEDARLEKYAKGLGEMSAELEQVKAERDAAIKAVKNIAEYIVCAGRVDYYLCDEISQEHHLKYQPKNDGNYDNEPCYRCIADWFLQGHEWQENCW